MKTTILAEGVKFPESPRWHDDRLWFCDYAANKVMNVDLGGQVQTVLELPDLPVSIEWTPEGKLLVVLANERKLIRLEGDRLIEVADMSGLVEFPCADMVVDNQGRAYIGNLGFEFGGPPPDPPPGSILLATPDGHVRSVAQGLAFPNGMVISPDGKTLVVSESYGARLRAFDIAADGSLSGQRAWAQFAASLSFEQGRFTPDGISMDAEGAIWVAALNQVLRIGRGAEVMERIAVEHYALACMLGGPERRTLFILTTEVLNPMDKKASGRIEMVQVKVPGAGWPQA